MSRILVRGVGAVSPAGWGVEAMRAALEKAQPLPTTSLARPDWKDAPSVRTVPPPATRPAFLGHPRLRRASPIAQHLVAAACEALGNEATLVQAGAGKGKQPKAEYGASEGALWGRCSGR